MVTMFSVLYEVITLKRVEKNGEGHSLNRRVG